MRTLAGQRVTVMGLGRFGGGLGAVRFLAAEGARVLVTDLAPEERLADSLAQLVDLVASGRVTLRCGGHDEADFTGCDLVVASPAVPRPWENPYLDAATRANVPITTEIRLLVERIDRGRVIGVTGSAGKSTTAAMIHHVLARSGCRAHFGGNIGGSLLTRLETIDPGDWIVLELSSAMLHWLGRGVGQADAEGWSPHIAVLTNLDPNHLDWHGSFEHYRESKLNILRYQHPEDRAIETAGDDAPEHVELSIPGAHNQANARLAITAAAAASGRPPADLAGALRDFRGLPHRLQLVASHRKLQFYNDSKSTTPQATVLAVRAFAQARQVHLIVGGYDKRIDLGTISDLAPELAGLYAIGATGRQLALDAQRKAADGFVQDCGDLQTAVDSALSRMRSGDVLLLSPGCASWDQFEHFEERGERFCALVEQAIGRRATTAHA